MGLLLHVSHGVGVGREDWIALFEGSDTLEENLILQILLRNQLLKTLPVK